MNLLNAKDVFEFSVTIEKNGEKFYRKIAQKFTDPAIRDLFVFLADEEVKHAALFQKMTDQFTPSQLAQIYPDDYLQYLKAYVDHQIFTNARLEKDVEHINRPETALEFGIWRELDTILYYQEIKKYMPAQQLDQVDKIIAEERKHFLRLIELKKQY
ncbi:MAG: ferritin family protein [Candidatus Cloacimonetes bacterium]|nr:ferritin family protein [Candidatus Cloacimonadota bacterium]